MKKKTSMAVILATTLALLTAVSVLAVGSIEPIDDTWVDLNAPTVNKDSFGLLIDYTSFGSYVVVRRTYLRFDLSGLTQDVDPESLLRLRVALAPVDTSLGLAKLRMTGDDWNGDEEGLGDETTLVWNNAPSVGTLLDIKSVDTNSLGKDVDFSGPDLVAYINSQRTSNGGDDRVSFAIEFDCTPGGCSGFGDAMAFDDREQFYATGFPPQLIYSDPTAVTLLAFEVTPVNNGLLATWQTATELDNLGFNLYRGESATGPWDKLNSTIIPAQQPGSITGAVYEWLDEDVLPDTTVFYRLEDVDIRGVSTFHGPVSATSTGPAAIGLRSFDASSPVAPEAIFGCVCLSTLLPLVWSMHRRRKGFSRLA